VLGLVSTLMSLKIFKKTQRVINQVLDPQQTYPEESIKIVRASIIQGHKRSTMVSNSK
jgi:hypothetical protein